MEINYRPIKPAEYPFIKDMLYEAIYVPTGQPKHPKSILDSPELSRYIEQWGQKSDDIAIVAVLNDELIGAVWGRKFSSDKKGFGYIDEETPEIGMAIKPSFRGKGIGTALLSHIEIEYQKRNIEKLSLSVNKLNKAKLLYEKCGYQFYKEQTTTIIMVKTIN